MRPRPRAVWLGATAVVALVAALAIATIGRNQPPRIEYRQTYLQFNLCGNACSAGGLEVITAIEEPIRQRAPFLITLNEVCENQYTRLHADLGSYQGRFDPTGPTCTNGARYGNALLVRATGPELIGSWLLPNPAHDETRRLMCLRIPLAGTTPYVACVTHISNESANIGPQVAAVAELLRPLTAANAVLIAGDFNTDPADPRLDPLYSKCYSAGTGDFEEVDSPGCASRSALNRPAGSDVLNEGTYNRHKYDYVFLSNGGWSGASAVVTAARSDHEALWGTATLRTRGNPDATTLTVT